MGVLSASDEYFEAQLRHQERNAGMRRYLNERCIEPELIRRYGIGCAPFGRDELTLHLLDLGFHPRELIEAGVSRRSAMKDQLYDQFRSRIMFPIRMRTDDPPIGFYGLAVHPGPSWTRWLVSPRRPHFDGASAVFGVDIARASIAEEHHAVVMDDCVDAVRRDGAGTPVVAIVRSRLTRRHMSLLHCLGAEEIEKHSSSSRIRSGGW